MPPEPYHRQQLREFLLNFLTPERAQRFRQAVEYRTQYLTVALENIFQPHNASAVLRTCECLGIQDVHIIENRNPYRVNPDITLGSSQWLSVYKYSGKNEAVSNCVHHLKSGGYQIVATTPHHDCFSPEDLPLDQPVALFFGTELEGLSEEMIQKADRYLKIPMSGLTESMNISVSVAICMYTLIRRIRTEGLPWGISQSEKDELLISWARNSLKNGDALERQFYSKDQV